MKVSGRNRTWQNSPHYQVLPYAHAGSYGSLGSLGSYNDGAGLGSSYGSYGDNNNLLAFYSPVGPSGMNFYPHSGPAVRGPSSDTRRIMQLPHGNGLGVSPGNFVPMSLGTSPSQFTPPSSYGQMSSGSPGHYGPPSPVRGNCHGSPLGKVAAVSQYHRRKNWGYPGSAQSQEMLPSPHWHGQPTEGIFCIQAEGNSNNFGSTSLQPQPNFSVSTRRHQKGASSTSAGPSSAHNLVSSSKFGCDPKVRGQETPEPSNLLPDPGDWDPNYRYVCGLVI